MIHRYRLHELTGNYFYPDTPAPHDFLTRYVLKDETGTTHWNGDLPDDVRYEPDWTVRRAALVSHTFAAPAEAWAWIEKVPHLAPETLLYKYTFVMKAGRPIIECYSQTKSMPGDQWAVVDTINNETLMVAMSEVEHLYIREI